MSAFPECQWQPPFTKGKPCEKCGRPLPRNYEKPPRADCPVAGYGDRVASAIKFTAKMLHIERWVRETPGCGCRKRREGLNRFGRWVAKWRKRIAGRWKALPPQ